MCMSWLLLILIVSMHGSTMKLFLTFKTHKLLPRCITWPPKFVTMMIMGIGKFYSDGRREVALRNLIHNTVRELDITKPFKDLYLHTPTHIGKQP